MGISRCKEDQTADFWVQHHQNMNSANEGANTVNLKIRAKTMPEVWRNRIFEERILNV